MPHGVVYWKKIVVFEVAFQSEISILRVSDALMNILDIAYLLCSFAMDLCHFFSNESEFGHYLEVEYLSEEI